MWNRGREGERETGTNRVDLESVCVCERVSEGYILN